MGFARAYMDGDWDSPDISSLLELAVANEKSWLSLSQPSRLTATIDYLRHRLRRNSKSGSRRNIAFHYDLGNRFYGAWLDETMTYSSALFTQPGQTLAEAQNAKYDRIVEELQIGPDDHVLEIGCGWGGFAEYAMAKTGCRVTGLTLSQEQAAYARNRLAKAGLSERSDIRLEDYRDCQGTYSKIVSIEMFEAVGEENWPVYFKRVRELLAPGGKAVVQVITIDEPFFDQYRRNADFIQTYIFPGGMLPSITAFRQAAAREGVSVTDELRFGQDYDRTLMLWDRAFIANGNESSRWASTSASAACGNIIFIIARRASEAAGSTLFSSRWRRKTTHAICSPTTENTPSSGTCGLSSRYGDRFEAPAQPAPSGGNP